MALVRTITVLMIFVGLSACTSSGVKVDQATFDGFQKGKTTCSEIISKLGSPTQTEKRDNGDTVLAYNYIGVQSHPENFIPIAGAFVRGYDTENTMALFKCNPSGVLIKTLYSGGGQGTGVNAESVSQNRKDTRTTE